MMGRQICLLENASSARELCHLSFEVHVPVGIIFHNESAADFVFHNTTYVSNECDFLSMGVRDVVLSQSIHMSSPASKLAWLLQVIFLLPCLMLSDGTMESNPKGTLTAGYALGFIS